MQAGDVTGVTVSSPGHGDNAHLDEVDVAVRPSWRRRGTGRALLAAAGAAASARGQRVLELAAPTGTAGEQFLAAVGARAGLVERQSALDVGPLDRDRLQRLSVPADGYRVDRWQGPPPSALLDGLAGARESMDDAPKGELSLVRQRWRGEHVRAEQELLHARGTRVLGAAVVHEASGGVVGYTDIELPAGATRVAFQQNTVVVPAHRGHRLGLALKAANLLRVRQAWPAVTDVITWNAEGNRYMLRVNDELGFRPTARWLLAELEAAAARQ